MVDQTNRLIQLAGSPSVQVSHQVGRLSFKPPILSEYRALRLTGVQRLPLGGQMVGQPAGVPQEDQRHHEAEFKTVQSFERNSQPADVQEPRGRLPGPQAGDGGREDTRSSLFLTVLLFQL